MSGHPGIHLGPEVSRDGADVDQVRSQSLATLSQLIPGGGVPLCCVCECMCVSVCVCACAMGKAKYLSSIADTSIYS